MQPCATTTVAAACTLKSLPLSYGLAYLTRVSLSSSALSGRSPPPLSCVPLQDPAGQGNGEWRKMAGRSLRACRAAPRPTHRGHSEQRRRATTDRKPSRLAPLSQNFARKPGDGNPRGRGPSQPRIPSTLPTHLTPPRLSTALLLLHVPSPPPRPLLSPPPHPPTIPLRPSTISCNTPPGGGACPHPGSSPPGSCPVSPHPASWPPFSRHSPWAARGSHGYCSS